MQPKTLQETISKSEDHILKLYADYGTIGAAPALATSRFINIQLKALKGETDCVDCAFIRQTGHIGQYLPYMTSIVRLGERNNFLLTRQISSEYMSWLSIYYYHLYFPLSVLVYTGWTNLNFPSRFLI